MPSATLKLNALSRAQITRSFDGSVRIVRTGFIKNLDLNAHSSNDEILAEAFATPGMPSLLAAHPGSRFSAAKLRTITIDAVPQNNKKAFVTLVYDAKQVDPATPIVTFVLQRRTTLQETITELHPNGLKPMITTWRNPAKPNVDVIRRTTRLRYLKPFQRVVATGYYKDSPPPAAMIDALGSVNDATWRGKPKGYWLYADQSDVTQDKGNSYNITLELWTKLTEDWSSWDVLRDHVGRNLFVDPEDVTGLKEAGYLYGMLDRNGIKKTGLYPTTDFSGIFGFGGIA